MIGWIQTHPYAAGAIAALCVFAIVCALLAMDWLRDWLDVQKAVEDCCAEEGAHPERVLEVIDGGRRA